MATPDIKRPNSKERLKMKDIIRRLFHKSDDSQQSTTPRTSHDATVSVCALFLELARIDKKFSQEELETLLSILKEKYDLSPDHADELMAEADRELQDSVDLWQFASLINQNFTIQEKIELVEQLWRIVYVDGKMEAHEHYLMNKLSNLLRLSHSQLIDAKLKVLHGDPHRN